MAYEQQWRRRCKWCNAKIVMLKTIQGAAAYEADEDWKITPYMHHCQQDYSKSVSQRGK